MEKIGRHRDNRSPITGGNDYFDYSYAKYLRGHPLYPKARSTGVYIYNDRIEIADPELRIPYSAMSKIEDMDEDRIDRDIVILGLLFFTPIAIHAAIRKKKHTYTLIRYAETSNENQKIHNLGQIKIQDLIRYKDEMDEVTIVLDFNGDIDRIQSVIYNKIVESMQELWH